jgi:hypothetical protein
MPLTARERARFGPRTEKRLGSVDWCWQTLDLLKIQWQRKDFLDQEFEETLAEVRRQEVWKTVPPEGPYGSLDTLLKEEIGCGQDDVRERLVARQAALAAANQTANEVKAGSPGGDRRSQVFQQRIIHDINKKDIMNDVPKAAQGTSRTYALRRLAKDRPDLHAQCLAGELTAYAAMVQAGFRTRPPSRKRTPLDSLHHYWRQVSPEERLRFVCEMLTPHERRALQDGFDLLTTEGE